ncbi:hypothetical protein [Paenibacillus planticolens]|uniref:UvrA DNA-binding domain-containing protein n=1 Tax=Paenibacillus planticolens TaxID=2654976 RepID=A0ABX1ZVA4_9BACL|nr:hypothetical protein [Paenibacillus planticolens]NOV03985.1 hypothetical protein [Paenibacillus planticolens]
MEFGLPHKKFYAKRPGSLVSTITGVLEPLWLLYANTSEAREKNGVWSLRENSPNYSTCPTCNGTGTVISDIDPSRMIATELSLKKGAVLLWAGTNCGPVVKIRELAKMIGIEYEKPLAEQDRQFTDILLYGYDKAPVMYVHKKKEHNNYYRGCVFDLKYLRDAGTTSKGNLWAIKLFSHHDKCPSCSEIVLKLEHLIMGNSLSDVLRMPISESLLFVQKLRNGRDTKVLDNYCELINDIELRLSYLNKIGLKSLSVFDVKVSENPKVGSTNGYDS